MNIDRLKGQRDQLKRTMKLMTADMNRFRADSQSVADALTAAGVAQFASSSKYEMIILSNAERVRLLKSERDYWRGLASCGATRHIKQTGECPFCTNYAITGQHADSCPVASGMTGEAGYQENDEEP